MDVKLGRYQHYKGKCYEVIGTAFHSETLEELVVYRALYDNEFGKKTLWARPKRMFCEAVYVDDRKVPRFTYIG